MKFLFTIFHDEHTLDDMPAPEMQALVDAALDYDEEIRRSGHYIVSNALQRARTARTLRVRGGKVALHRREVGVVYQDHRLLTDRTVGENVALPLILRGTRRAEIGKRVRSVLERMGLGHREKALPSQLTAGEQQRGGIARAIIAEPQLLVADEPTGNLDPTLSAEIMELFAGLPDRGTSVLVVSHDLPLLRRMRKRVLILDHGRLVDDISPQDLAE